MGKGNKVICSCRFQLIEIQLDHKLKEQVKVKSISGKLVAQSNENLKLKYSGTVQKFVMQTETSENTIEVYLIFAHCQGCYMLLLLNLSP